MNGSSKKTEEEDEVEAPAPMRNFTTKQLRHFDGGTNENSDEPKPVYLSVGGSSTSPRGGTSTDRGGRTKCLRGESAVSLWRP